MRLYRFMLKALSESSGRQPPRHFPTISAEHKNTNQSLYSKPVNCAYPYSGATPFNPAPFISPPSYSLISIKPSAITFSRTSNSTAHHRLWLASTG
jgi:hypothetical protein